MKNVLLLIVTSLTFTFPAFAQVSCESLRDEIANKIINNGVPESGFRLDIVPVEQAGQAEGKIVGGCGGGTNKIMYTRFRNGEQNIARPTDNQIEQQNSQSNMQSEPITGESLTQRVDTITESSQLPQADEGGLAEE